ncbi:hypothetical protein CTATCC11996_07008 [Comamonas testosteroni ATCC 11996]|nr:hypothetical protein CTATCC11996_07008 [Comamonas testosteroni ATCC 11996]
MAMHYLADWVVEWPVRQVQGSLVLLRRMWQAI